MTAQPSLFDIGHREVDPMDLSQWWTPVSIAERMVAWCGSIMPRTILEPSAGCGRLVDACNARWSGARVTAHELHGPTAETLAARYRGDLRTTVLRGDYLEAPAPRERFDLCVMNPPYEHGFDGRFLAKAMDESVRVVALVRLVALAGQARHREVWSRIDAGEWHIAGLAVFAARPEFDPGVAVGEREVTSAQADFCVVKLTREPTRTSVEWWMP